MERDELIDFLARAEDALEHSISQRERMVVKLQDSIEEKKISLKAVTSALEIIS